MLPVVVGGTVVCSGASLTISCCLLAVTDTFDRQNERWVISA